MTGATIKSGCDSSARRDELEVRIERNFSYPAEKLWWALTQPHLLSEWLMKTDFSAAPGATFSFTADWGSVDCALLEIEPEKKLCYTWGDGTLDTIVTWTLTPTESGTRLSMAQTGFRPDQSRYYGGAKAGWPKFFDNLGRLLATHQER